MRTFLLFDFVGLMHCCAHIIFVLFALVRQMQHLNFSNREEQLEIQEKERERKTEKKSEVQKKTPFCQPDCVFVFICECLCWCALHLIHFFYFDLIFYYCCCCCCCWTFFPFIVAHRLSWSNLLSSGKAHNSGKVLWNIECTKNAVNNGYRDIYIWWSKKRPAPPKRK